MAKPKLNKRDRKEIKQGISSNHIKEYESVAETKMYNTNIDTYEVEYPLTRYEISYIDGYLETRDKVEALKKSKYMTDGKSEHELKVLANRLFKKPNINDRIKKELEIVRHNNIATSNEILSFYSDVMRGKIKDQFGLEASLTDRLKAASELAKRTIDIENKREEMNAYNNMSIRIDWRRGEDKYTPNLYEPDKIEFKVDKIEEVEVESIEELEAESIKELEETAEKVKSGVKEDEDEEPLQEK